MCDYRRKTTRRVRRMCGKLRKAMYGPRDASQHWQLSWRDTEFPLFAVYAHGG